MPQFTGGMVHAGCDSRDSIANIWGSRTPFPGKGQWPEHLDEHVEAEPDR